MSFGVLVIVALNFESTQIVVVVVGGNRGLTELLGLVWI